MPMIPVAKPELFEGVLARRFVAFVIDIAIIVAPGHVRCRLHLLLRPGHARARLGAVLAARLPATIIWAICLLRLTFGSRASATIGMRVMDLEMRTWYGAPAYFVLGAVHAIVFWLTRFVPDAAGPAGRLLQRTPAAAARYAGRHGRHQQSRPRRGCCGATLLRGRLRRGHLTAHAKGLTGPIASASL